VRHHRRGKRIHHDPGDAAPFVRPLRSFTQRDICTTFGALLEVLAPQSQGVMMQEIFKPVSTGIID